MQPKKKKVRKTTAEEDGVRSPANPESRLESKELSLKRDESNAHL